MVGCRRPCALKYSAEAAISSGLSDPCPSLEISAWVCTSMATSSATFIRPAISRLRDLRGGDAVGLGLGADGGLPGGGDLLGGPPALAEGHRLLRGVGPEREPVAADADRLAGDPGRGVRGEEDDEPGDVVHGAEAHALAQPVRQ